MMFRRTHASSKFSARILTHLIQPDGEDDGEDDAIIGGSRNVALGLPLSSGVRKLKVCMFVLKAKADEATMRMG